MEENIKVIEMGALVRGQGNRVWTDNAPTLRAEMGDNQPCVMMEEPIAFMGGQGAKAGGLGIGKQSPTLKSADSGSNRVPCVLMDQGGGVMNVEYDKTGTLRRETHGHEPIVMEEKVMAFAQNTRDEVRYQNGDGQITGALAAQPGMKQTTYIKTNNVVRRLTPIECERLQGFPDNFTNIPWANKATAPDSRRYKALGNSMAVPVMRWIGKRIQESQPVVYNEEAIRNAMIKPLSQEEKESGQQSLF